MVGLRMDVIEIVGWIVLIGFADRAVKDPWTTLGLYLFVGLCFAVLCGARSADGWDKRKFAFVFLCWLPAMVLPKSFWKRAADELRRRGLLR